MTSGGIPRLGKCQRLAVVGLTKLVEPMGRDAIVARLVHAVEKQSGPTKCMVVPGESADRSPPTERLVLDVAFGQPAGYRIMLSRLTTQRPSTWIETSRMGS